MYYSKKWFIKPFGHLDVANSSIKNMCIDFVTIRRIFKKSAYQQL